MKIVINILKKIVVVFGMFVGIVDAMDLSISRKESKFDFLKLHELRPWYEKLSVEQKQALERNLEKQDEKNKALFKVATQLPLEVQKLVVAHMFDNYNYARCCKDDFNKPLGEYEGAVNKFYEKPVWVAFNGRSKAANFLNFLKEHKESVKRCRESIGNLHLACRSYYQSLFPLIENPYMRSHIIFEFLEDLFIFNVCDKEGKIGRCWFFCSKNELQSINRVLATFSEIKVSGKVKYKFHDSFTFDNFKKQFHVKQFGGLSMLLAPCEGEVSIDNLSQLLQRTDIVIE
jgi:hypothetical protein